VISLFVDLLIFNLSDLLTTSFILRQAEDERMIFNIFTNQARVDEENSIAPLIIADITASEDLVIHNWHI
jgi:hypothetical protein